MPISGFECRTLCCSLLFRHIVLLMDGKTDVLSYILMQQMNFRDCLSNQTLKVGPILF